MATKRGERTRALVVVGQCLGYRQLAAAARVRCLADDGRLGRGLAARLLGCRFFFFLDLRTRAARRFGRTFDGLGGRLFLLFEATGRFFFGVTAGGFIGRLARILFGFALLGGNALLGQTRFFDCAVARFRVGTLAGLGLGDAGIGKCAAAASFSSSVS